jgi:hypothetical protein
MNSEPSMVEWGILLPAQLEKDRILSKNFQEGRNLQGQGRKQWVGFACCSQSQNSLLWNQSQHLLSSGAVKAWIIVNL